VNKVFQFFKMTVLGGIIFLIPVLILVAVIGKALELTNRLAAPLAKLLPVDSVADLAITQLLTVLILVMICFFAGLAAKTAYARKLVRSLESNFLDRIPAYTLIKTKAQTLFSGQDTVEGMQPVMVRFDDSWQVAFVIETLENDRTVLFLPGAPDPWSGAVCIVATERTMPLDIKSKSVTDLMKRLGMGTRDALGEQQVFQ
jgi:uncharacterized membrane protein